MPLTNTEAAAVVLGRAGKQPWPEHWSPNRVMAGIATSINIGKGLRDTINVAIMFSRHLNPFSVAI